MPAALLRLGRRCDNAGPSKRHDLSRAMREVDQAHEHGAHHRQLLLLALRQVLLHPASICFWNVLLSCFLTMFLAHGTLGIR